MVSLGARGNTEAQMSKVLSVSKDGEVHQRFEKLISEINKPGANYSLSLANRLFGETSYDFLELFLESTQKFYHAGLEKLNFKQAAEDSRRHINAWVEEKTTGKIQNLLAPGIINSLTKLALVNAIYFKGNWANQFNKDYTEEKPFHINKNETKTVQMMFRKGKYNMTYISDYRTSILEIPYVGSELSMIILLPEKIEDNTTGLEKLEREITYEKLIDWINPRMMDLREIELSFPKFKLEEEYDLKPVLRSMGMTDAFDEGKADFSGMSTNNDLVVSEVVHKSFIEVNEEGTEAAAATAALVMMSLPTLETCPFRPPSLPAGEGQSPRALPSRQFQSPLRRSPPRHVKTGDLRGSGSLLIRPTWSSLGRLLVVAMNNLANANSQFALDLFQKLNEAHPTGNIFFSPVSISSSLAMILLGARDNTAAELSKTLHFDGVEDLHSGFHRLNTKINRSNAPYILTFANRLYGEKTFNFLSDFLTSTQNLYGAELATVDFSNAPDKAKNEINQWVEQQTEGKIPELLSEGSINEMTKLVLVSAVYFKGSWAKAFKEEDTEDKPFRLNKTEKKNVKMMFMKEKLPFGYIPECKCRVLELPYNGEDLSMIILLPDEIEDNSTGLEQLEKQLTLEKLQEWTQPKNMNSDLDVYVHLPKFQLEENYDLKSYFAAMGLLDVFDSGKANFPFPAFYNYLQMELWASKTKCQ
ncbi:serpin A3-7-like [Crotalus adamanteus]|uniref:Leukocyte elastase inhibitor n=1 Tax=Crotalus adamanteus TaxID=8729 RepID=A0AAW1BN81_CROAD